MKKLQSDLFQKSQKIRIKELFGSFLKKKNDIPMSSLSQNIVAWFSMDYFQISTISTGHQINIHVDSKS